MSTHRPLKWACVVRDKIKIRGTLLVKRQILCGQIGLILEMPFSWFNPIHYDIFSYWFIMRELIINSIWILYVTNSLSIYMSCFLSLVVEQLSSNYQLIGSSRFESWLKQPFSSCNVLLGGYLCSLKCPGLVLANFELMISSFMIIGLKDGINFETQAAQFLHAG